MPESPAFVWLFVCLFGITTLFVLRMAIDCIRNEEGPAKFLWLGLLIFTHIAGAILFFMVRYLPRVRAQQRGSSGSSASSASSSSYGSGSSKKRKRAPHKKPKGRGPG
jgi:hypothetical protein